MISECFALSTLTKRDNLGRKKRSQNNMQREDLANSSSFLVFLGALIAIAPFSIDAYLPAFGLMAKELECTTQDVNLTISAYLLGLGIGQLIGGPLSDQLGRKKVGCFGLLVYMVASVFIIFSTSIYQVQLLRLVQGAGGGFATVICLAQLRDVYAPSQLVSKYANVMMVMLIAPLIAPLIGISLLYLGWRFVFIFLLIYTTLLGAYYLLCVPETKADKVAKVQMKPLFTGYQEVLNKQTNGQFFARRYVFFSAFSMGVFMSYIINAPTIFLDYFSLSPSQFTAVFTFNSAMIMLGNRLVVRQMKQHKVMPIIQALNTAQIGLFFIVSLVCLFDQASFVFIFSALLLHTLLSGALTPSASGLFISLFDKNAGSASSLLSTLNFSFGGAIGGLASYVSSDDITIIFIIMLISAVFARLSLYSANKLGAQV